MSRMRQASATAGTKVTYENLWQDGRWLRNATIAIDPGGHVADVSTGGRADAAVVPGFTLPGLVDAHGHAFQRPLGAWTQRAAGARDDFWSWR